MGLFNVACKLAGVDPNTLWYTDAERQMRAELKALGDHACLLSREFTAIKSNPADPWTVNRVASVLSETKRVAAWMEKSSSELLGAAARLNPECKEASAFFLSVLEKKPA